MAKYRDIPQFTSVGSYAVDYPINRLSAWIDEQVEAGLQLTPDFQRGHIWTKSQQQAYIEFLLRGGKTGRDIYFNDPSWRVKTAGDYKDFVCVDGLQRITAILAFSKTNSRRLVF